MVNVTRILCPTDFSEASQHALDQAIIVAGFFGAHLTVLHVCSQVFLPVPGLAMPAYGGELAVSQEEEARLRAQADAFAAPARAAGLAVDVVVEPGLPIAHILSRVAQEHCDLIVMGTHGTSGFEHLVLGSVTEKILRKATCPVLTVPPRVTNTAAVPFTHILCAIDFSECALAGLAAALSLAQEAEAELTLLHVLDWPIQDTPPVAASSDDPTGVPLFDLDGYRRVLEADAGERLEKLIPAEARAWCAATTLVAHGKPHVELLKAATERHADLIVLGVRGRNPFDVMLFGSTTNQVVRQATCPVLTVHS